MESLWKDASAIKEGSEGTELLGFYHSQAHNAMFWASGSDGMVRRVWGPIPGLQHPHQSHSVLHLGVG
jgi:hypothetical protein